MTKKLDNLTFEVEQTTKVLHGFKQFAPKYKRNQGRSTLVEEGITPQYITLEQSSAANLAARMCALVTIGWEPVGGGFSVGGNKFCIVMKRTT